MEVYSNIILANNINYYLNLISRYSVTLITLKAVAIFACRTIPICKVS